MTGSLVAATASGSEPSMTTTAIRDDWKVQYARFFNYPCLPSTHPSLAALPAARSSTGTWISLSSSSTASLKLLTDLSASASGSILSLTFRNKTLEEHYISKLHFTWPHVSCISGYPARGSRSVLLSYTNHAGKIQKFALRFSAVQETENFTNFLKEIFDGSRFARIPRDSLGSGLSSQSEFVPSSRPPYSTCEDLNHVSSACTAADQMPLCLDYEVSLHSVSKETPSTSACQIPPSLDYKVSLDPNSKETILNSEMEGVFSAFPPSFTSLLMNCCAAIGQAPPQATAPEPEENDLKSQITRYLEDSSFQDAKQEPSSAIVRYAE